MNSSTCFAPLFELNLNEKDFDDLCRELLSGGPFVAIVVDIFLSAIRCVQMYSSCTILKSASISKVRQETSWCFNRTWEPLVISYLPPNVV